LRRTAPAHQGACALSTLGPRGHTTLTSHLPAFFCGSLATHRIVEHQPPIEKLLSVTVGKGRTVGAERQTHRRIHPVTYPITISVPVTRSLASCRCEESARHTYTQHAHSKSTSNAHKPCPPHHCTKHPPTHSLTHSLTNSPAATRQSCRPLHDHRLSRVVPRLLTQRLPHHTTSWPPIMRETQSHRRRGGHAGQAPSGHAQAGQGQGGLHRSPRQGWSSREAPAPQRDNAPLSGGGGGGGGGPRDESRDAHPGMALGGPPPPLAYEYGVGGFRGGVGGAPRGYGAARPTRPQYDAVSHLHVLARSPLSARRCILSSRRGHAVLLRRHTRPHHTLLTQRPSTAHRRATQCA
jgi:hypothetical protein